MFEPEQSFDAALLDAMEQDIVHRGPDSGAQLSEPGLALVFRRLAIMDPRHDADQPMYDDSRRYALVFNGEIYNQSALRAVLEAAGDRFRTTSDSEVLLLGLRRHGVAFLDRLEGMYAFVFVDRRERKALVARDPLGIKPLYMMQKGRLLAFASEMTPLYRLRGPEPDLRAVSELLTFDWAAGRLSNIAGIDRLPGGTVVEVDLTTGRASERRFCDPLETLTCDSRMAADDLQHEVESAVTESVSDHLMSDVGYTLQLSGGVDSSVIAALVAKADRRKIKSFGLDLVGEEHNEAPFRRMVAGQYGLDHHEIPVDGEIYADALPRAVRHMEGPVAHSGCPLLMLLCDQSRAVSKVILTGEGADEFFGGYSRYGDWKKLARQEALSNWLPRVLTPPLWPFMGIRRFSGRDFAAYASVYHDPNPMWALFPGFSPPPGARETASARFGDFRSRMFAVDQMAYLESLLVRQDKMSMAASVEARVPFTHMPLARLLNRIPHRLRAPGGRTKPLLKTLADKLLPHELVHRRKIGLVLPIDRWLSDAGALGRYLDWLTQPDCRLAAYADPKALRRIVERYRAGERRGLPSVWRLVNVETWLRSLHTPRMPASPRSAINAEAS